MLFLGYFLITSGGCVQSCPSYTQAQALDGCHMMPSVKGSTMV